MKTFITNLYIIIKETTMAEFKAYITNLGLYNEGSLVGKWVSFPVDDNDWEKIKSDIQIDATHEEYFMTDYEGVFADMELGEYESIETLNHIAEALADKDDEEIARIIYVYKDNGSKDIDKAIKESEDATYISPAANCDYDTDENLAYSYIADVYGELSADVVSRDFLETYFDEDSYIRDYNIDSSDDDVDSLEDIGMEVSELDDETLAQYFNYDQFGRELKIEGFNWVDDANCWI